MAFVFLGIVSLSIAVILTATGLQIGESAAEDLLIELQPVNDPASNGQIVLGSPPASCNPSAQSDEWKVDVSMPEQGFVIKRVEVFMRFAPGPPPVDNTVSARLDGGLLSAASNPDAPFFTSISVSQDHGDGAWIDFNFPDYGLDGNLIAFAIRAQPTHETSAWDDAKESQSSLRGSCAGSSDAAWFAMSTQLAIRIHGSGHGTGSEGGRRPSSVVPTFVSPFFFGLSLAFFSLAMSEGTAIMIRAIVAVVLFAVGFVFWTSVVGG
jgi:hypothetical protein